MPLYAHVQEDGDIKIWAELDGQPGKFLRVVTLEDGVTIHTGKPSAEPVEVVPEIVVDLDEDNAVAGIDIVNTSKKLFLGQVEIESLPVKILLHA